eukprot:483027-Rhodomonas_salina.3
MVKGVRVALCFALSVLTAVGGDSHSPEQPASSPPSLPPASLTIITHAPTVIRTGYAEHSIAINSAFAKRHGYNFRVIEDDVVETSRDAKWSKVRILKDFLTSAEPSTAAGSLFVLAVLPCTAAMLTSMTASTQCYGWTPTPFSPISNSMHCRWSSKPSM